MGKIIKSNFTFLIVFIELVIGLHILCPLFIAKSNHYYAANTDVTDYPYFAEKWDGFYKKKRDSIDVIFMGTSIIHTDIDPNYLYSEYGFTSYDLSADQLSGISAKYFLNEALKTQNPKVVVMDVQSLSHPRLETKESGHYGYDFMNNGMNKIRGVVDLYGIDEGMLFPLTKYHSRWEELNETDFNYLTGNLKNELNGHLCYMMTNPTLTPMQYDSSDYDLQELGYGETEAVIDDIADICKKNNITCILLRTPNAFSYKESKYCDAISKYAEEKDIKFWNYNDPLNDSGINYDTDYVDGHHLNQEGAEHFSNHLGKRLVEECDLPDHRGMAEYEEWEKAYENEQYFLHDFDIRHYDTVSDLSSQRDFWSENLIFIFTFKQSRDMRSVIGLPSNINGINSKTNSCIYYNGGIADQFELKKGNRISSINSPIEVQYETIDNTNRIWIEDEFVDLEDSNGIVDLIIYDMRLGKILDHDTINVMNNSAITHLLNPYNTN